MVKQTVKTRIFVFNTLLVLVTLIVFLFINVAVIKIYTEPIEDELKAYVANVLDETAMERVIRDFTIRRNEFILFFLADGIMMIAVLVLISYFFTKNMVKHLMKPLNALSAGAERIINHDLTQDIEYTGDVEFENVCRAFNDMRRAILSEQEKNQKYEKARTDMIVGISHDLRTPLTAIRGTIKGLLDGVAAAPEMQQKFLETAYRRTEDMARLLDQLFYLSKLETGNMPLHLENIEIADFLKSYVGDRQKALLNEQIKLTADLQDNTGYAAVDLEQLQRVLDNLLTNSRKYGEIRPLHITITLAKKQDSLIICFADNGVGVAEEKLAYIFEEFYRVDESRHKKDSNGLGLYIVKHLIEAMGGRVWAKNTDGLAIYMELPEV